MRKHMVIISGAGMSAESGVKTFRDHDGLWENHRIEEVATPEAWERDWSLVLRFYNERRKGVLEAEPNAGHRILAQWEREYQVSIVTQNVDDLHERAGSTGVLHLHGELRKARSTADPDLVYPIEGWELKEGDLCERGSQLRPHIVWFGEMVPMMPIAEEIVRTADILIVVGTSLQVYPAASLVWAAPPQARCILIDPRPNRVPGFRVLEASACDGLSLIDADRERWFG